MENLKICSPKEREDLIYAGLKIYTRSCMGDYLETKQMDMLADILKKFRSRPAEIDFCEEYCSPISTEKILRNIQVPRKTLRKDECAIFFYNVAPYSLLTRRQTALLAKRLFPNFFAGLNAIDSYFTRHINLSSKEEEYKSDLSIVNLPKHTTAHIENLFFELGYNNKYKSNGRK